MIEKTRKQYKKAKSVYQESMMLGFNEETERGKDITEIYCKKKEAYLFNIKDNNTEILFKSTDSFERIIAFIETFEKFYTSMTGKVDDIEYKNTLINDFVVLINELIEDNSTENHMKKAVEYLLVKDITDDVFADLVKKVGWENIFEIDGLEYAEALAVDYQLEEYELIILNDKVDLIDSIEDIILLIEANTDFFEGNNDEINDMIDKTIEKVVK